MTQPTYATIDLRPGTAGQTDLVITPAGGGRGRVSFDRTLTSPLLIALGSDRRAAPDDTVPSLLTAPDGTAVPLGARRGWVGDVLLADGQRLGSRLWLLERARRAESTRLAAEDYANEAVTAIADYHATELTVSANWQRSPGAGLRGVLAVTVQGGGVSITQKVQP
ncbi:phage GP46 family protein [Bombella apis]|uniref:phage GP46 family protein n=1 Tax=Bombella apis TaxID=1785988 RepID=UPI0024A985A2|nr:phage GP46 family protein [Bombella apis]